jgi:hypothetical protein
VAKQHVAAFLQGLLVVSAVMQRADAVDASMLSGSNYMQ